MGGPPIPLPALVLAEGKSMSREFALEPDQSMAKRRSDATETIVLRVDQ